MTTTAATTGKQIEYNGDDYDMFFDGEYIGSRGTRHEAEQALDAHAYSLISRGNRRPVEVAPMVAVDDEPATLIRVDVVFEALVHAYDVAADATVANSRWHNAVCAAFDYLLPLDTLDYADGVLTVQSATSDAVYAASPTTCQCAAFKRGNPCWHRAAARLVQLAVDGK